MSSGIRALWDKYFVLRFYNRTFTYNLRYWNNFKFVSFLVNWKVFGKKIYVSASRTSKAVRCDRSLWRGHLNFTLKSHLNFIIITMILGWPYNSCSNNRAFKWKELKISFSNKLMKCEINSLIFLIRPQIIRNRIQTYTS